jgi:NAD(P)-dependent dehydrogenase (short-subunit alcohol dehydrogenase family)
MSPNFAELKVIITGAGTGIGRALAAGFCEDGAEVIGFGRTPESLHETAQRFGRGRLHPVAGDLASAADVDRLFADAMQRFGRVDVLVNNGAIYPRGALSGATLGNLEQALAVNVVGMARCSSLCLPGMLERGYGRIVNLGSFAWKRPLELAGAYSISKAAVSTLTRALAVEIDRARYPNVLVNELVPGAVKTNMSAEGKDPKDVYPELKAIVLSESGGPSGATFEDGHPVIENQGLRARVKRLFGGG